MTAPGRDPVALAERLTEDDLRGFVARQRWFGSKSRDMVSLTVREAVPLRGAPPLLVLALVECGFDTGLHETYHLPIGFRPADEGWTEAAFAEVDGFTAYDAAADPLLAAELVAAMGRSATVEAAAERLELRSLATLSPVETVRPIDSEQSNTSLVLDERHVLKLYRRTEPGINPELELLRFLTDRGCRAIAPLEGWFALIGGSMDATLGILQPYLENDGDGWTMATAVLRDAESAEWFLLRVRRLGEVTGRLHTLLASEADDPNFAPEEPDFESLPMLGASLDEEAARLFGGLPGDVDALDPVRGRGEDVRERIRALSAPGPTGLLIRTHGDLHLGQVLWAAGDWVVIDFEGEPARSLHERRHKRSPLRDVAGMLRSLSYAAVSSPEAPGGWERRAREAFLDGYRSTVEVRLVPPAETFARVLALFELEKALYELRYELDNRPDWVHVPVAGIVRLLDEVTA